MSKLNSSKLISTKRRDHSKTDLGEGLAQKLGELQEKGASGTVPVGMSLQRLSVRPTEPEDRRIFRYSWCKGIFDRPLAFLAIVVLSPLLTMIAVGIRLDSPGNSIFCQERVGKDGRKFTAYKFRTMYINNDDREYRSYLRKYILENAPYRLDKDGCGVYKVVDDPRVTRFGAFLRRTNLDELPQFFNILKGEMSLIGPRPEVSFALDMYNDWHWKRLSIRPGITGLWQVYGRKGLSFKEMVRLDIEYIERQSLHLDAKILLRTIYVILTGDGR